MLSSPIALCWKPNENRDIRLISHFIFSYFNFCWISISDFNEHPNVCEFFLLKFIRLEILEKYKAGRLESLVYFVVISTSSISFIFVSMTTSAKPLYLLKSRPADPVRVCDHQVYILQLRICSQHHQLHILYTCSHHHQLFIQNQLYTNKLQKVYFKQTECVCSSINSFNLKDYKYNIH